jgi:hypothetical protein
LTEYSRTGGSPAQALSNQCTGWCCIDRLSWQRCNGRYHTIFVRLARPSRGLTLVAWGAARGRQEGPVYQHENAKVHRARLQLTPKINEALKVCVSHD